MMTAVDTKPVFLYPRSQQFPFDEVCEQIVRELEKRNWDVPGITVEFTLSGTGDEKYRYVQYIKGDGFKLWFCRVQGQLDPNLNDIAAVTEIIIPQKELHVHEDESGPTLRVYVGKDWPKDKERFLNGSKVNSKLNKEPRWYLEYSGSCNCGAGIGGEAIPHTHQGGRSPLLVHSNDPGREYDLKRGEPKQYRTWDVLNEFTQWLKENVLTAVLAEPEAEERIDLFPESITPFPDHLEPIFCFGEHKDAHRIHQGKVNLNELQPSDRYGLMGSGWRLTSLGTSNDGSVPEIAYEGFLWAGFGTVSDETAIDTLDIPGSHHRSDQERFVFKVTPQRADDIYVADHAPYEKRRKELSDQIESTEPDRKHFNEEEIGDFNRARARTIVPIADYDGSFEQPIVLINRELDLDEVELVSGPCPEYQYVMSIVNREPAIRELFEQAVAAHKVGYLAFRDEAKQAMYARALKKLVAPFRDDQEFEATVTAYEKQIFRRVGLEEFMARLLSAAREMQQLGLLEFNQ